MRTLLIALLLSATCVAQTAPRAVVDSFYKSYTRAMTDSPSGWVQALMAAQEANVEKPLREMMIKLAQGEPGGAEPWLDFDPFSNSQQGIESYSLGQTTQKGGLAYVPVKIRYPGEPGAEKMRAKVVLRQSGGAWKIANVAYPAADGAAAWDLLGYLKESFKK